MALAIPVVVFAQAPADSVSPRAKPLSAFDIPRTMSSVM
jgi:hypothetical protein